MHVVQFASLEHAAICRGGVGSAVPKQLIAEAPAEAAVMHVPTAASSGCALQYGVANGAEGGEVGGATVAVLSVVAESRSAWRKAIPAGERRAISTASRRGRKGGRCPSLPRVRGARGALASSRCMHRT